MKTSNFLPFENKQMGQGFEAVCLTRHQFIDTCGGYKIANHGHYQHAVPTFVMKLLTTGGPWANTQLVWAGDYSTDLGKYCRLPFKQGDDTKSVA